MPTKFSSSTTIRPFRPQKSDEFQAVATIWLESNLDAHFFVDPQFWRDAQTAVEEAFRTAEIYVALDASDDATRDGAVRGFVGLDGERILGLFVDAAFRSRGIGAALVSYCKATRAELSANVYALNDRAVRFYRRQRFEIVAERTDDATGAREFEIVWRRDRDENVFS